MNIAYSVWIESVHEQYWEIAKYRKKVKQDTQHKNKTESSKFAIQEPKKKLYKNEATNMYTG